MNKTSYFAVAQNEDGKVDNKTCSWGMYNSTVTWAERCFPRRPDAPWFWIINCDFGMFRKASNIKANDSIK